MKLLLALLCLSSASASEIQLVHATSNANLSVTDLRIEVDGQGTILNLKEYVVGEPTLTFDPRELAMGIVLSSKNGKKVTELTSNSFDTSHGGKIDLVFLTNGITNEYLTFPMELTYSGRWQIYSYDEAGKPKVFKTMFMKARKYLGQVIGIESIQVSR
jgi:hypothetical protein